MKRTLALIGLGAVLSYGLAAIAVPNQSTTRSELREQIDVMLSAPEYTPESAEWLALGAAAAGELRSIAEDSRTLAIKRGRAISALANFADAHSLELLSALVLDGDQNWLVRTKAARSLTAGFGERGLSVVETLLWSPELRLREGAIRAVSLVPSARACDMLRQHAVGEESSPLREIAVLSAARIEQALASELGTEPTPELAPVVVPTQPEVTP